MSRTEVEFRYDYDKYNSDVIWFRGYNSGSPSADDDSKEYQMYIFVQYYDEKYSNNDFFGTQFINQNQAENVEWIIINDCQISSSTRILPGDFEFKKLIGLDLSFNSIFDFNAISHIIQKSPNLKYLDLSRNPIEYQEDLVSQILLKNPGISVINRKRVTPLDFYKLFNTNPKCRNSEFFISQMNAAIRTIHEDRIKMTNCI